MVYLIRQFIFRFNKKDNQKIDCLFKWCHQESNRGHKDFQSFALPTELWHHHVCNPFGIASAKVGSFFEPCNFFGKKFKFYLHFLCRIFLFSLFLYTFAAQKQSESSAVGSVLRSGRRGREFESPLSDSKQGYGKQAVHTMQFLLPYFFMSP